MGPMCQDACCEAHMNEKLCIHRCSVESLDQLALSQKGLHHLGSIWEVDVPIIVSICTACCKLVHTVALIAKEVSNGCKDAPDIRAQSIMLR
mmetsp:Transcript_34154/g.72915  ORF Transcript_34154/g.72915 Transcript_34154/m.72915 type:complete len:92 (+) Transcript_34154:383-658(+)